MLHWKLQGSLLGIVIKFKTYPLLYLLSSCNISPFRLKYNHNSQYTALIQNSRADSWIFTMQTSPGMTQTWGQNPVAWKNAAPCHAHTITLLLTSPSIPAAAPLRAFLFGKSASRTTCRIPQLRGHRVLWHQCFPTPAGDSLHCTSPVMFMSWGHLDDSHAEFVHLLTWQQVSLQFILKFPHRNP